MILRDEQVTEMDRFLKFLLVLLFWLTLTCDQEGFLGNKLEVEKEIGQSL